MPQINDIRELAQQNARYVSNSPQDWMSYIVSSSDAFVLFWSSHSVILLHFIVAKQLPISRRRSAANTFMWSQIAKIQDFVRTVGMGNGIPIKIAGNEKSRK